MRQRSNNQWVTRQPVVNWWSVLLLAVLLSFVAALNDYGPTYVLDRTLPDGTDLLRIDLMRTLTINWLAIAFAVAALGCWIWSLVLLARAVINHWKK